MRKIISISLLLLFLTSHLGLAVGTHYCYGMAVKSDLMLGHEHLDCGMETMEAECNNDEVTHLTAEACCENEYSSIEVSDDFSLSLTNINVNFVVAFTCSFFDIVLFPEVAKNFATQYYPPSLEHDVQVLFQSFLI